MLCVSIACFLIERKHCYRSSRKRLLSKPYSVPSPGQINGNIRSDVNKAKSWDFLFGKIHFDV